MKDARSDNAYSRLEGDHHQRIANGNYNSATSTFDHYYTTHMQHVGRINRYLDHVDEPYVEDEAVRNRYENILRGDRKSTRLQSSHVASSYSVFFLKHIMIRTRSHQSVVNRVC